MPSGPPLSFARVNGVNLHYALHRPLGRGDGRPALVFINALGTDMRIWNRVAGAFAGEWTVLTYDKRGHGLSQAPSPPYRMEDHVSDCLALVERLGLERIVPVGISVGGMIAQGLMARAPARAAAAVLCDTGLKIGDRETWNERIETALGTGGVGALAEGTMERWFPEKYRREKSEQLAGWRTMLTRTPADGYAGTCYALRDADCTAAAAAVKVPVLCIVGEHDGSTPPEVVRALADAIPEAEYREIAGAGHLPPLDDPDAVIGLIAMFLKRLGTATE